MSSQDTRDEGFIALFKRLPIACMLAQTSDSTVLAINAAFEQLFGWSPELSLIHI